MFWLFVYGSLKPGECNFDQVERFLERARPAQGPGRLFLRPDGYPALWLGDACAPLGPGEPDRDLLQGGKRVEPGVGDVSGSLLELEPSALGRLDRFEGYRPGRSSEYLRVLVAVWLPDEQDWLEAWTYVCAEPDPAWPQIDVWPPEGSQKPAPYRPQSSR
jgi:gamma-glutamylcyclotransferase (GGCT)/AIG2-like uncharacterized protein YtfP